MLRFDDDDDDFSLPRPSSRLAALFSQDKQPVSDDSFKYKAPKDPAQKSAINDSFKKTRAPPKTTLLCAYSGHCFKLVNDQYTDGQKLGVAIIGEVHNNLFSILLYVTKEKPVSFTRITPTTVVEVGSRNFVSFTDDLNHFWSVGFVKEEEIIGFTKQVALARWMSGESNNVNRQDLLMGDGSDVGHGDLVEVKVERFRLVTEGVLILDPMREDFVKFKIGKKAVPQTWEESVIGMKKLGMRLLIYSGNESQLVHDSGDKTLEVIAEQITLLRVKYAKGKDAPKNQDTTIEPPDIRVMMERRDSSPHNRTQAHHGTAEDQPASKSKPTNNDKAVLMNRIKKLGQPMLPMSKGMGYNNVDGDLDEFGSRPSSRGNTGQSPDFMEDREVVLSQMLIKPEIRPKPAQMMRHVHDNMGPLLPIHEYQLQRPISSFSPFISGATISHSTDPSLSLMMIDIKQHNLDLKGVLMRTSDKLDTLSSKMDDIHKSFTHSQQQQQQLNLPPPSCSSMFSSPLLQCEVNAIYQGIDKIFKDNELMRREVREREIKIGNLTQKMNEISDSNQRLMQKKFDENTTSIVATSVLSEENVGLKSCLEETKTQLTQTQQELSATKQLLQTRSDEVRDISRLLDEIRVKLTMKQGEIDAKVMEEKSRSDAELERMKKMLMEKEDQLTSLKEERANVEHDKKTKMIEYDRIIADLRETLMRRKGVESSAADELEKNYSDKLDAQEELYRTLTSSWQEEKANLLNKLSDGDKKHQLKLNEVINQKNNEMQVIKEELKKLSQEYNLIKTLSKELKEKYDWILEQHDNHVEQSDSKVKTLMNNIYRCFREGFVADKSYVGAHVLSYASKIIKSKTLEMMSNNNANQNNYKGMTSSSSSSLTSSKSQTQDDVKIKLDVAVTEPSLSSSPTTSPSFIDESSSSSFFPRISSSSSTLTLPSLSEAGNFKDKDDVSGKGNDLHPSSDDCNLKDQFEVVPPTKSMPCNDDDDDGEWSKIGSQKGVEKVIGHYRDHTERSCHDKSNDDSGVVLLTETTSLCEKPAGKCFEKIGNDDDDITLKVEECLHESVMQTSNLRGFQPSNLNNNTLADESNLATAGSANENEVKNKEQPIKCEGKNILSNECQGDILEKTPLDISHSDDRQTKSEQSYDNNDDDSPIKPPPFPESDMEDDLSL